MIPADKYAEAALSAVEVAAKGDTVVRNAMLRVAQIFSTLALAAAIEGRGK